MSDPYRQPGERPEYRETNPEPLPVLGGSALDKVSWSSFGLTRKKEETDEAFRARCLASLRGRGYVQPFDWEKAHSYNK